jgi:N-acetyl-anhydromuramyl-L-alanine amidase AmpD
MRIEGHRLVGGPGDKVAFKPTPNVGGAIVPEYLILHSTNSDTAHAALTWLLKRGTFASTHVVIDRDGSINQLASFDREAWHVGRSRWEKRENLNRYSIGVSLVNAGPLARSGEFWVSPRGIRYPSADALVATHKFEEVSRGWHQYTPQQLEAASAVASAIFQHYRLKDVLGHEDVSPGVKFDPGPSFPMSWFRARAVGGPVRDEPAERIPTGKPVKLFYSYAHEDEEFRKELVKHLSILRRKGIIEDWHDRKIVPGQEWKAEIDKGMEAAHVILLLVSSAFLTSDYCYDIELKYAMDRHARGDAHVIPIILRPVDWKGAPFDHLQALPPGAKPITKWRPKDEAFFEVALGIRKVVDQLTL